MFIYVGRNKRVKMAANMANQLMQNHEGFMDKIENHERFEDTEVDSEDIALFMRDRFYNDVQTIVVSKRYKPWGSVLASFNSKRPTEIRLNYWNLKRTADSITGSIVHEYVHLVDFFYKNARFGHKYHYHPGRENTAPYAIGSMAKKHCIETID